MAKEAVKVELTNSTGFPREFTCASGVAITKGTLLVLSDPRTAATTTDGVASKPIAGIASMDKAVDDFSTTITAWTDGIFEMYASGAIQIGDPVVNAEDVNCVKTADTSTTTSGAAIFGYALEAGSEAEVINIRVRV